MELKGWWMVRVRWPGSRGECECGYKRGIGTNGPTSRGELPALVALFDGGEFVVFVDGRHGGTLFWLPSL